MIALCTDKPTFSGGGEQTLVTFPSGEGEGVTVALNRNQLAALHHNSRKAMIEAFNEPQPEVAGPALLRSGKGG